MIRVVAIARDCEMSLRKSVETLLAALDPLVPEEWFVVESDSSDSTREVLAALSKEVLGFSFVTLGHLSEQFPKRIPRISQCREICREWAASRGETDFTFVMDADGVILGLEPNVLGSLISSQMENFDAIMPVSVPYYDVLALRRPGVIENDYRYEENRLLAEGAKHFAAKHGALIRHQVRGFGSIPLEVDSAFGGLAVYRGACMRDSSYLPTSPNSCEHVTFNLGLRKLGKRIAIHPQILVSGDRRHTKFAGSLLVPIWKLLSLLPNQLARRLAFVLRMRVGINE